MGKVVFLGGDRLGETEKSLIQSRFEGQGYSVTDNVLDAESADYLFFFLEDDDSWGRRIFDNWVRSGKAIAIISQNILEERNGWQVAVRLMSRGFKTVLAKPSGECRACFGAWITNMVLAIRTF